MHFTEACSFISRQCNCCYCFGFLLFVLLFSQRMPSHSRDTLRELSKSMGQQTRLSSPYPQNQPGANTRSKRHSTPVPNLTQSVRWTWNGSGATADLYGLLVSCLILVNQRKAVVEVHGRQGLCNIWRKANSVAWFSVSRVVFCRWIQVQEWYLIIWAIIISVRIAALSESAIF